MIQVTALTRTYGGLRAVDDVSFTAQPGRVTGFLGPNGAGKSTTMRVMVGLTPATSGSATVLGRRYADLPNPGREVGVLLDASAQHAGRTGRETLRVAARTMGLPMQRVDELLDLVSLTGTEAERRVKNYSLGMRQRLGIATALIGDPEVLILDEPANGLDPAGIRWMRDLLRGFANKGGTVLLSSHLLHEIEVIADDLVVIGQGRIVAQGTKAELLESAGTLVRTSNVVELARALELDGVHTVPTGQDGLRVEADPTRSARSHWPPAYPSQSCAPPTAPASRRCSSSSLQTRPEKEQQHDCHRRHHRPRPGAGGSAHRTRADPVHPAAPGRAGQDVRHPCRLLAHGVDRRHRLHRDGLGDPVRAGQRDDLRQLRRRDRRPDDAPAAGDGDPLRHQRVHPTQRAHDVHLGPAPRPGDPREDGRLMALGAVSIGVALAIGALGNIVGSTIAGVDTVWDISGQQIGYLVFANVLNLLIGFMLGVLIRNSPGAIVGFVVYSFVLPTLSLVLGNFQQWWEDLRPWLDFNWAQGELYDGSLTGAEWAHLGTSGVIWLVVPLIVGLVMVMRSEVK